MDSEFVSVSAAFAEQRAFTELAFATLEAKLTEAMNSGFGRLDRKVDRVLELLTLWPRRRRRS